MKKLNQQSTEARLEVKASFPSSALALKLAANKEGHMKRGLGEN
jgi:hypothetical protein